MASKYTRYAYGQGGMRYCRTIRAPRWDAGLRVRHPGTWEAAIVRPERRGRPWRWVVGHYGRDEHVLARGEAATLREAREAADEVLDSLAGEIRAMQVASRWIAGDATAAELLETPGALGGAGY